MDRDILRQILPTFLAETREHLETLGRGLLALEKDPTERPADELTSVLRIAHSLKGSAASLGFTAIERLAHALEDALAHSPLDVRLDARRVEAGLSALQAVDAALTGLEDGSGDGAIPELDALMTRLRRSAAELAPVAHESGAHELWPAFRGEVFEYLDELEDAAKAWAKRKRAPGDEALERLRALVSAVRGTGTQLGLHLLASEAERALQQLERPGSSGHSALREAVVRLRGAAREADESVARPPERAATPTAPAPVPATTTTFHDEVTELLAEIEERVPALCTPDEAGRLNAATEVRKLTHRLKGTTGAVASGDVARLALELHEAAAAAKQPGAEGAQAVSALTGVLIDLRKRLQRLPAHPDPAPKAPAATASTTPAAAATAAPAKDAAVPAPTPAAANAGDETGAAARGRTDRMIRVSTGVLDAVAAQVEDLVLARNRHERRTAELQLLRAQLQEALTSVDRAIPQARALGGDQAVGHLGESTETLRRALKTLGVLAEESYRDVENQRIVATQARDHLRQLRTVPAETLFDPLHRAARDVAGRLEKAVAVETAGGDVRLDRRMIELLRDPLLHLVRNAIDHGLEAPHERRARGKPETGRLRIAVEPRGHRVAILLSDDGRGLQLDKVRDRAVKNGIVTSEAARAMSEAELQQLIFRPGFSTAEEVTQVSGRGVGLDVVMDAVSALHGTVEVKSTPGAGATFEIDLPQTLGALLSVVVEASGFRVALPNDRVEQVIHLAPADLGTMAGQVVAKVGDHQLPYAPLAQALGLPLRPRNDGRAQPAIVVSVGSQRAALGVDVFHGQQEAVVHPLGRHLAGADHLSGAAMLDDGAVVGVLHPGELLRRMRPDARGPGAQRTRILVADDALTTRAAMKAVLEIAGFAVVTASDGEEALARLAEGSISLVVSDVQMPRLDGLGLTRRLRQDPKLHRVPVILVTSLDSADDRAAGMEAGADAYLVKRDVERGALLDLVRQLLPEAA